MLRDRVVELSEQIPLLRFRQRAIREIALLIGSNGEGEPISMKELVAAARVDVDPGAT